MSADPATDALPSAAQRFLWRGVRGFLVFCVVAALLAGAVCFVFAALVIAEGKVGPFCYALAGGLACWFAASMLGRGSGALKRRLNDWAVAAHARALRLDPSDARTHNNQGVSCHERRDYARAIAHFDAAIRLDPRQPNAYVGRVNAYGALGQWERVIAEYSEVIRLEPNHALAHCARATACNAVGRWDRSIPDATTAIQLDPDLYLGYDARGFGYLQRGHFNGIMKLVAAAWSLITSAFLRPDPFDWRRPTGTRSDFEHAVADFTEAIRLNPQAWDCYAGRAQAYRALGAHDQAEADTKVMRRGLGR